jgi:type II secretory pathway component PulJ
VNLDPATLAVGAAVGGSVGTLAAIIIVALILRFAFHSWQDLDGLRTQATAELRAQNADLRRRIEQLERRLDSQP